MGAELLFTQKISMGRLINFMIFFTLAVLDTIQSGVEGNPARNVTSISNDEFVEAESADVTDEMDELPDPNNCFLMFSEAGIKAVYICEDGNVWAAAIEQLDENCVYRSNVTDPSGETDIKEATINCIQGKEWIEDLVQNNIIYGIPDKLLFALEAERSDEDND